VTLESVLTVWVDESGHTGEDLMNADQPVFVLASSNVGTDAATDLARTYFGGVKATELKHGALAGRERGRRRILAFLRDPRIEGALAVDLWHREFTLFTTLVDFWVEEAMRRDGIDLYNRGANIGLSNLTYLVLMTLLPRHVFRQHMLRYQTMMRTRTREAYSRFWVPFRALFDVADGLLRDNLLWFIGAEARLGLKRFLTFPARMLSVTQSSLLTHVDRWSTRSSRPLRVVHDTSSALAKHKWALDAILTADSPPIEIGYDRRKMRLPLRVQDVRFADSASHTELQFVDIVAGAMGTVARNSIEPDYRPGYADEIRAAAPKRLVIGGVWPSEDVEPEALGTTGPNVGGDPTDLIAAILRRARAASPAAEP
jgi:hypothetical protein